jgi:hypothetical protein
MDAKPCFEVRGDTAVLRLAEVPPDQAGKKVTSAIALTRDLHVRRLVVIAPPVSAQEPGANQELFGNTRTPAASDDVQIALVAARALIDPEILSVRCFPSEDNAMVWLEDRIPKATPARPD